MWTYFENKLNNLMFKESKNTLIFLIGTTIQVKPIKVDFIKNIFGALLQLTSTILSILVYSYFILFGV